MKSIVPFQVRIEGDTSKQTFEGFFEARTKLSHRDVLREDEVRRNVLGTNPGDAGSYAASLAQAIAYLTVRITKSPPWWQESGSGLDLEDENVLVAVNNACVAAIQKERDAMLKEAAAAQAELKGHAKALDEEQ